MDQNVKKYKFYCLDAQHCIHTRGGEPVDEANFSVVDQVMIATMGMGTSYNYVRWRNNHIRVCDGRKGLTVRG